MTSKCLVTFRERNFVLPFDGTLTRRGLVERVGDHELFRGIDVATLIFTMFEEDFNVFVDIPEDFEIRDRAKIKVSEDCQVRIADVLDEPQQAEQSRVTATYSLTYSLPAVPNDIKFSIERHQSGQYFRARSRVVQWLYHDLCLYTMYPGKLYNEAAQALVSRYPNLADSSGTGYAQLEFELITSVPVLERLEEALQRTKEKNVHAARKKRHLEGFLEDFDARMDGTSEAAVYETTVTAAVCLLPSMVKERVETFVRPFDPAAVHYIPTVVHNGGILTTTDFSVCLEKICIKETSLLAAVATQMALYWAFNIVFDKKAQRSFDLLCRLINVDSGLRPTPLVRLAQTVMGK
ncbi:uncharacterized protein LOC144125119 [Amblyomma americanum]